MQALFLQIENILFYVVLLLYIIATVLYFVFFGLRKDKLAKPANIVLLIGFIIHTLALVARTIGAGRLPLTNQYEFATSFAWGIALCCLVFIHKFKLQALGTFASPVLFLIIGYAAMQSKVVRELMPSLRSGWLAFHVITAIISYGSFAVAFAVSLMFLFRQRMADTLFTRVNIPDEKRLDIISYRVVAFGFLFLTLVIVTGAIWAEQAWGSYWSWDPKETWALITWIIYAIYLHLRLVKKWYGKPAALFAVIGFICVIFTYIGVNLFLPGIHSYASVPGGFYELS